MKEMKNHTNDVMVSGITLRSDDPKLALKAKQVNETLAMECNKLSMHFIDNSNIDAADHLNGSGLHLNFQGTVALARNFINSVRI